MCYGNNIPKINNININHALKSDDKDKWIVSMKKEYENLISHGTWELEATEITSREDRSKVVKTMWVLTIKRNNVYKAWLVAIGDRQSENTYNETYASTLSYESLRLTIAEAAILKFEIQFMDISNAYVNAKIDTEIFIQLPENTPFITVKNHDGHELYAHKLLKSLYGLKQSGRNWLLNLEKNTQKNRFRKMDRH